VGALVPSEDEKQHNSDMIAVAYFLVGLLLFFSHFFILLNFNTFPTSNH